MNTPINRVLLTEHADERCLERGINPYICDLSRKYGKHISHRGAYILHFEDIPKKVLETLSEKVKTRLEKTLPICSIWATVLDTDGVSKKILCLTAWRIFENSSYKRLNWRRGKLGHEKHKKTRSDYNLFKRKTPLDIEAILEHQRAQEGGET